MRADPRFMAPQARKETIVLTTPAPALEPTTASGWILSPRRRKGGRRGRRLRWRRRKSEVENEVEGVHGGGRRWRRTDPEVEGEDGKRWRRRRTEPENILNILTNMQLEEVRSDNFV